MKKILIIGFVFTLLYACVIKDKKKEYVCPAEDFSKLDSFYHISKRKQEKNVRDLQWANKYLFQLYFFNLVIKDSLHAHEALSKQAPVKNSRTYFIATSLSAISSLTLLWSNVSFLESAGTRSLLLDKLPTIDPQLISLIAMSLISASSSQSLKVDDDYKKDSLECFQIKEAQDRREYCTAMADSHARFFELRGIAPLTLGKQMEMNIYRALVSKDTAAMIDVTDVADQFVKLKLIGKGEASLFNSIRANKLVAANLKDKPQSIKERFAETRKQIKKLLAMLKSNVPFLEKGSFKTRCDLLVLDAGQFLNLTEKSGFWDRKYNRLWFGT